MSGRHNIMLRKIILRGGINFTWPAYDFYKALDVIHHSLPCGAYKDKDILIPFNFQFTMGQYNQILSSFDLRQMRFCERSIGNDDNGTKGRHWRIYPIVNGSMEFIGFDYEEIRDEAAA